MGQIAEFNLMHEEFQAVARDIDYQKKRIDDSNGKLKRAEERLYDLLKAREIIQIVAKKTQENLQYHISNLVTLCLKSVSPKFPSFIAEVKSRRNQTECDLLFEEDGETDDPIESSGGGPINIAGNFGLRTTTWVLDRNRPILLLDEPFRDVSPDLQEPVSWMVRRVAKELGLQIIMVSHQDDAGLAADKVFRVRKEGKESIVTEKSKEEIKESVLEKKKIVTRKLRRRRTS